uniref:VWFD domain-containing protein n=1 Tax=Callorhinchus milii TaxID=7868 RepID=A0A4W3JRP9_CALMI
MNFIAYSPTFHLNSFLFPREETPANTSTPSTAESTTTPSTTISTTTVTHSSETPTNASTLSTAGTTKTSRVPLIQPIITETPTNAPTPSTAESTTTPSTTISTTTVTHSSGTTKTSRVPLIQPIITETPTIASTLSTAGMFCHGIWTEWINTNVPSLAKKNDEELLDPIRSTICNSSTHITNIQCESLKFPNLPISETEDNVTCDIKKGLVCNYNGRNSEDHLMCLDYRIRVCCESRQSTAATTKDANYIIHSSNRTTINTATTPPTEECYCNSIPRRKCNETWRENCTTFTCVKEETYNISYDSCEVSEKPVCLSGLGPVRVPSENGCCAKWECDCECQVWGDPHYRTFDRLHYNFFENCTYVLVEEIVPKYNFSVILDNYFCLKQVPKSCPKTLIIYFKGNVLHFSTGNKITVAVNGMPVNFPYNSLGFNISELDPVLEIEMMNA